MSVVSTSLRNMLLELTNSIMEKHGGFKKSP